MSDLLDHLETLDDRSRSVDRAHHTTHSKLWHSPSVRSVKFADNIPVSALDHQMEGIDLNDGMKALDVKRALVRSP